MSETRNRISALADVTLAIAQAAAASDSTFVERLGTNVRESLARRTGKLGVFDQAMLWLGEFEGRVEDEAVPLAAPDASEE